MLSDLAYNGRQKDLITAQLLRSDAALNLNGLYSFRQFPDESRLRNAIERVSSHFASLNSIPIYQSGQLVPQVLETQAKVKTIDSSTSRDQFDKIYDLARSPFKILDEPPFRAFLIGSDRGIHHMFLQFHHVATDWWSFRIVHKALTDLYKDPSSARLQPDTIAESNKHSLSCETFPDSLEFWNKTLERPYTIRSTEKDAMFAHREWTLPIAAELLEEQARKHNQTLFEWLFLRFGEAITASTGKDTLINTPVGNRSRAEDIGTVGYLMNVVPVRCSIKNGKFEEEATLKSLRGASKHGHVSRGYLAKLSRELHGTHSPLFDIVFMFLRDGIGGLNMPASATFTRIYPGVDEDRLVVTVREAGGKITVVLEGCEHSSDSTAAIAAFLQRLADCK